MSSNDLVESPRPRWGRFGHRKVTPHPSSAPVSPFRGIFDEDPSKVNPFYGEITRRLEKTQGLVARESGAKKPWGIRTVLMAFLFTLLTQGIIAAVASATLISPGLSQAEITEALTSPAIIVTSSLAMYATWFSMIWFVAARRDVGSNWQDHLRLRFRWKDIPIGLGLAAGMILALQLLSWVLQNMGVDLTGSDNGSAFGPGNGIGGILVAIFIATLAGPISEEFFFRGFILRGIQNSTSRSLLPRVRKLAGPIAVILSSIVFGFMHFQGADSFGQWFVVIVTGTLGLVFGTITYKLNRIGPAVVGHIFYNGGTVLLAYLAVG